MSGASGSVVWWFPPLSWGGPLRRQPSARHEGVPPRPMGGRPGGPREDGHTAHRPGRASLTGSHGCISNSGVCGHLSVLLFKQAAPRPLWVTRSPTWEQLHVGGVFSTRLPLRNLGRGQAPTPNMLPGTPAESSSSHRYTHTNTIPGNWLARSPQYLGSGLDHSRLS